METPPLIGELKSEIRPVVGGFSIGIFLLGRFETCHYISI
jgi:hypothetical protein